MFASLTRGFNQGTMTFAALALAVAVGGASMLLAGDANALPLAKSTITHQDAQDSDVTLVRDGCGRGMRFSNSRNRCVRDNDGRRGDDAGRTINRVINQAIGGSARRGRDDCGRGMRWSNSRGRCVRN